VFKKAERSGQFAKTLQGLCSSYLVFCECKLPRGPVKEPNCETYFESSSGWLALESGSWNEMI
jgi:hypothetical protein